MSSNAYTDTEGVQTQMDLPYNIEIRQEPKGQIVIHELYVKLIILQMLTDAHDKPLKPHVTKSKPVQAAALNISIAYGCHSIIPDRESITLWSCKSGLHTRRSHNVHDSLPT